MENGVIAAGFVHNLDRLGGSRFEFGSHTNVATRLDNGTSDTEGGWEVRVGLAPGRDCVRTARYLRRGLFTQLAPGREGPDDSTTRFS